jgi:hypothetical protein
MPQLRHRGIVAIILAAALGLVLVILAGAVASGVQFTDTGRAAAWALIGALAGAIVTYMTATSGKNGTQPPSPPK